MIRTIPIRALASALGLCLALLLAACSDERKPEAVQLPDDVPQYPASKQTPWADAWRSGMGDVDLGTLASYVTDDKPGKVLAFYRSELEGRGWHIEDGSFIDELARVRYAKGLRNVTIWVFRDSPEEPTHLFLSATEPPPGASPS